MNNDRRKKIAEATGMINKAISSIQDAARILEECKDEEQEAFDNLPDSLRDSERGERMEEFVGYLEEAVSALEYIE
jgi:hypothetical protein